MFKLIPIPFTWLMLILAVATAGLLTLFRFLIGSRPGIEMPPYNAWRLTMMVLRLAGFGLLALVLVGGTLMVCVNLQALSSETAPARQAAYLPSSFPFVVEEVTFSGDGGIKLRGWYVPPRNGATIILLHGYGGTRSGMLWHAEKLIQAGYGVLMYDERASGESEGERRSYGWEDGPDVGGALAFIHSREKKQPPKIGIAGCSIGGQIALQGAILYPEIAAVWADGPSNIRAADNPPPRNILTGLVLISNYMLDFMYKSKLGIQAPPPMIERIGSIAPRPLMLVGGGVELGMAGSEAPRVEWYAAAAGSNTQTWVIKDAVHCDGPNRQPDEYTRRMLEFFDAAFGLEGQ